MPSSAAYSRVCFSSRAKQAGWKWLVAAILLAAGAAFSSAQAPVESHPQPPSPSAKHKYLMSESLDLVTLETSVEDNTSQAGTQSTQGEVFVIQRIEFIGNRRVRNDTLKARIFSREGDTYNEETLRRDFQALWNTQFFEDVKLRVEDSPDRVNSKIIIFEVKERPVIRRIRYDGIHSISESDILDRFKERKVGLTVESQFDPTKIKKAQVVLSELLGEHGHQFAKITPQYERIASSNAVILIFKIEEGPKVKVNRIKFTGNHAFSDRKLIRAMRNDRPYGIPLYFTFIPVMSKTYDHDKLVEDIEVGIRGMYQDNGYFRVLVKDPIVENIDTRNNRLGVPLVLGKSNGKAVNITIPIEEGERYKMGTLKIVSADPDKQLSLKVDALKSFFPLKQGDILNVDRLRKALKDYTSEYGRFGFIDFTAEPEFDIDDASKTINVTLRFDEQKQYYVRRIDFTGNTTTRDKVIRRELLLDEGSLFDKRAWEISILRLNQLDYFDRIEADKAVEIKRNTKEGTVDLNLKVKEKGKQSIGLNGGVSGLAGGFIGLTYQTNNFLGLGETLTFSAQFGSLQRSFMFGFTEPYLFDRPISTGFTIFSSRYSYDQAKQESLLFGQNVSLNPQFIQNYNQNSTGFTAFASYPIRKFSFLRLGLTYGLTRTNITAFNDASKLLFQSIQYRSFAGPSALNGIISSTVTPTLTYNSVDNPVNPTTGKSWLYTMAFTGGPLGGNVNTITQVVEYKQFRPMNKHRNVLGYRARVAYTTGFGGKDIPPYSRFYMGGEDDLRGYDIRSVSPVTFIPTATTVAVPVGAGSIPVSTLIYTATLPGGDAQAFGNLEYRIPIVKQYFQTAFFFDGGTSGVVNRNGLRLNSAALEGDCSAPPFSLTCPNQFPDAKLTASLPIASGTNFRLRGSAGIEFVIQLPIVQAPFRIYYAYNVHRLSETLVAQDPFLEPTQFCEPAGTLRPLLQTPCSASTPGGIGYYPRTLGLGSPEWFDMKQYLRDNVLNNPGRLNYFEPKTTFRFTVSRTF